MERWLPVVGFEGSYEVSDQGGVRSLDRIEEHPTYSRKLNGKPLKPTILSNGYLQVHLVKGGVGNKFSVHVLVMRAFVGPRPNGLQICHNDGSKTNNHLSNLRYDTNSANMQDAIRHGTYRNWHTDRTHCKRGHEFNSDNAIPRKDGGRDCRSCHSIRNKKYRDKKKAAAR